MFSHFTLDYNIVNYIFSHFTLFYNIILRYKLSIIGTKISLCVSHETKHKKK